MKILIPIFAVMVWAVVLQSTGCATMQKADTIKSSPESSPANKPVNAAEENFAKEWKNRYESAAVEIERNRRLWQESKIANYDFVAAKYAGGVTNNWNRLPVLIKVRNGEKASIEKVEKDKDYVYSSRTDGFEDFETMDKFFDYLRRELEGGNIIDVKYDEKLGFPKGVIITFTFSYGHNTREIVVSKFEVIE